MKKSIFVLIQLCLVVSLFAVSVQAYTISYAVKDAYWTFWGNPCDHTYACTYGTCYAIEDSSRSGGVTWESFNIDLSHITKATCAGSYPMEWGQDGTCHQHTNRMLYAVSELLDPAVQAYSLTTYVYSYYGDFSACLITCY